MNGSGCKNCPVKPCETMNYRGSACAAQRAKFGLGDPKTNADRIRAMSDEELAIFVRAVIMADGCPNGEVDCNECSVMEICNQSGLYEHEKEWLQQPAEGE